MRFNISNEEVKTILEMHSKVRTNTFLIKEDAASDEERLRIAITSGCLKGGSLKRSKSTGNIFYRKPSAQEPGKEVDFFADMTFKFTGYILCASSCHCFAKFSSSSLSCIKPKR